MKNESGTPKNETELIPKGIESFEGGNESLESSMDEVELEEFGQETFKKAEGGLATLKEEGVLGVEGGNKSVGLSPEKVAKIQGGTDKAIEEISALGKRSLDDLGEELKLIIGGKFGGTREGRRQRIAEIGAEVDRRGAEQEVELAQKEEMFKKEIAEQETAHREKMENLKMKDKDSIAEAEKSAQEIVDNDPEVQALKAELARIKSADEAAERVNQAEMEKMKQEADEIIASLKKESEFPKAMPDAAGSGGNKEAQMAEILKAKLVERDNKGPKVTQKEMIDRMLKKEKSSSNFDADRIKDDFEAKMAEQEARDKERTAAHEARLDAITEKTRELSELSQEMEKSSTALDSAVMKNQEAAREANSPTTEVERSCQKCGGKTISNDSSFCSECGNKLEKITPEMVQKQYQANMLKLQQSYDNVLKAQQAYDQASQKLKKTLESQAMQEAA